MQRIVAVGSPHANTDNLLCVHRPWVKPALSPHPPWTIFPYSNNHLRDLALRCKDSLCILGLCTDSSVSRPTRASARICRGTACGPAKMLSVLDISFRAPGRPACIGPSQPRHQPGTSLTPRPSHDD